MELFKRGDIYWVKLDPIEGYPFEVFLKKGIGNISSDSKVKTNQIRTLDKTRLKERIGTIPGVILSDIERAMKIHLELR